MRRCAAWWLGGLAVIVRLGTAISVVAQLPANLPCYPQGVFSHHWRWVGGVGSGLGEGDTPSGKAYRLGLNILVYGLSH